MFNIIGKLFIACITALLGYIIITQAEKYNSKLNSPILPTIVFLFIGYIIGAIFINIYGNACDALLHCFIADCEINRDPKHSPKELRAFVESEKGN